MDNVFQYILQLQNYQPMLTILTVLAAFLVGLYVFFIYRITFAGVIYSRTFNLSLVMLCMVTATVIMFMANNVKLSLGMVGALSIVRFRTAIKEPLDIAFLFWAIAAGIVLAAGMIPLAVFGSVFIGVILLVFANRKDMTHPFIVVIDCDGHDSESAALALLREHTVRCTVKSKTARKGAVELNAEVRLKDGNTDFVNDLAGLKGVSSAVLVSYNGDYMG